jgi:hypothetical protein
MRLLTRGQYREVVGVHYGTPKEVWGFRTAAATGAPKAIALDFLVANAALFGLAPALPGLQRPKILESVGAFHVIFQQCHGGLRIHRAYVTVHIDRRGRVFLAKNRAVPEAYLPGKAAGHAVRREGAERLAIRSLPRGARPRAIGAPEAMWFPHGRAVVPSWRLRLVRREPAEDWIVHVDARTGAILSRYDNLARGTGRRSAATGWASVFDPSPVTALDGHEGLISERGRPRLPPESAYRKIRLLGLSGTGRLDGLRITTAPTRRRVRRSDENFRCRSCDRGFEEAMVYYHVDGAVRYLERLGYRGRRAVFKAAVRANVNGTREDNSWYSPHRRMLTFGTGWIDDAEDGETILHELGHAIQDAIVPGFGQSPEAAAMGEGFGDYFAGSFFAERKPARYRDSVMTWDGLLAGLEDGTDPPCLRRLDSTLTYANFRPRGDEHDNGLIWSATLWEIWRRLGRSVADPLILESHFQLDGFTTFARGARAILDADRNFHRGAHGTVLRRIFRRRGIGPV